MVHARQQVTSVRSEDRIAEKIADKTARLRAAFAWQEELKQYELDDDEQERLVTDLLQELDQDDQAAGGTTKLE